MPENAIAEHEPQRFVRDTSTCVWFAGLMAATCNKGVRYGDVSVTREDGRKSYPCVGLGGAGGPSIRTCPLATYPTADEVRDSDQRAAEYAREYLTKLASDICPICERKIERREQIGRCVYAAPCGHRLYQGRA